MSDLYRPNVAALLLNPEGMVLICERATRPGAWQFPQGGIDPGETPEQALAREVWEETGYEASHYHVAGMRGNYRYDYPPEAIEEVTKKRGKSYLGQEQTYFLCALFPGAPEPKLELREFVQYRWIQPEDFDLEWLPPFKREVYRQVIKDFFEVDLGD